MRVTRFVGTPFVAALVCLFAASSARSQITLLNETFDDDAVDTLPNTVDFHIGQMPPATGSQMTVAGPGGAYADPFGPAGNHSFVFDNFNGGSNAPPGGVQYPVAAWSDDLGYPGTTYRNGTVDFDLFMNNDVVNGTDEKFWTYLDFRLGFGTTYPSTVGDTIVYGNFRIQDGVGYYFFDNATGPSNGHPTLIDQPMHVKYSIFPDETYTLQVNGNFVQLGGNTHIPWRFKGPTAGFNVLGIASAFGPNFLTNKPFYIDNLKVVANVPEPATIALGSIGLGFLAGSRRRRTLSAA